jgi:two-component system sensor histidine kinase KdpD
MTEHPRLDVIALAGALVAVGAVTLVLHYPFGVSNASTGSTVYLLIVLIVAAVSQLRVAVATSIAAMLCLNFFFLPPVGTFTIADPQNWIALFAFLTVSLVASNLSAVARSRTREALSRRDELARLFDLSRDVLLITDSHEGLEVLARAVARRLDLDFVGIAVEAGGAWNVHTGGLGNVHLDRSLLADVHASLGSALEFDAHSRTYAGHRSVTVDDRVVRLVPLRIGARPIGILAASGRPVEAGTLDTLAGVVAIAIERTELLEGRRTAELTRQSEQLKTALLASLGHDLRTPLTAIGVAAANIGAPDLPPDERRDQADVILAEVERLDRLFQNVLEMARIDAGAVEARTRWTHPSEIVAAARDQVERTLMNHTIEVAIGSDVPVRLDPRLIATALAQLLENAAHYSPSGTAVTVEAGVTGDGLRIRVSDRGPGIDPTDAPHIFDRFYRGRAARTRSSGSGMGLWIVRRLLAVEGGRVWAENRPDGGAHFTIVIPVPHKNEDVETGVNA